MEKQLLQLDQFASQNRQDTPVFVTQQILYLEHLQTQLY